MPILKYAYVGFHTNNHDLTSAIPVRVTVVDGSGQVAVDVSIAWSAHFGKFQDTSVIGLLPALSPNVTDLRTAEQAMATIQKAALELGQVKISIGTAPGNVWNFNFWLDLVFDDGTRLSCVSYDNTLNNSVLQTSGAKYSDTTNLDSHPYPITGSPVTQFAIQLIHNKAKKITSNLTIVLRDNRGFVVARLSGNFGSLPDNSTETPITLPPGDIENPIPRYVTNLERLSGYHDFFPYTVGENPTQYPTIEIRMDVDGEDTWNFDFIYQVTFADKSMITGRFNNTTFNENDDTNTKKYSIQDQLCCGASIVTTGVPILK